MFSTATARTVTRSKPVYRQTHGQVWRRHLRRHAPAPDPIPPFAKQRVHNAFHHLADLSLPYDLWNEETEVAAIAHLLGKYPENTAARTYVETVQAYNAFNRRFEPSVRESSVRSGYAQVRRVAAVREQLPMGTCDAVVYAAALRVIREESGNENSSLAN
jgi:hypothetical protein